MQHFPQIDPNILAQAVARYRATLDDENRSVRDPVITPFAWAMQAAGYAEFPAAPGRCSMLRTCPICPGATSKYSTRYRKDGEVYWACPHCQTIVGEEDEIAKKSRGLLREVETYFGRPVSGGKLSAVAALRKTQVLLGMASQPVSEEDFAANLPAQLRRVERAVDALRQGQGRG
jgi:hypothetical protein